MTTRPGDDLLDVTVAADRHDLQIASTPRPGHPGPRHDYGYGDRARLSVITASCSCWCWTAAGTVNTAAPAYDPAELPTRLAGLHADHARDAHGTAT